MKLIDLLFFSSLKFRCRKSLRNVRHHKVLNLPLPNIITDGKANGWPVAIIPTPTGKRLASLVTVPVLKDGHVDFILGSWRAFHNYNVDVAAGKNGKDSDLAIIQAVYKAYGIEFIDGETADFARLSKYVNDYITHHSSSCRIKHG